MILHDMVSMLDSRSRIWILLCLVLCLSYVPSLGAPEFTQIRYNARFKAAQYVKNKEQKCVG